MAAWRLLYTGSPPTHTSTWTSGPTIHPMLRGVWSGACMTEPRASSAHRTTCGKKNTTLSNVLRQNGNSKAFTIPSIQPPCKTWWIPCSHYFRMVANPGDAFLHGRGQQRHRSDVQEIQHAGDLYVGMVTLLTSVQGEGPMPRLCTGSSAAVARPTPGKPRRGLRPG